MQSRWMLTAGLAWMLVAGQSMAAEYRPQAVSVVDDGYAGGVLKKIVNTGKLKFDRSLELRLSLDDRGHLLECRASNPVEAEQACAAAKAASPFGTPPYGVPTFVTLALWAQPKELKTAQKQTGQAAAKKGANTAYLDKVRRELRNAMYVPAQAKPGTYHVTTLIRIEPSGKILDCSIVKGSGDELLDRYCLQGIKRAGKVPQPPAGTGSNLEVTFTLTRQ